MKHKIKILSMSLSLFGILSPLVKISTSQINIYLGLSNIGIKPFLLLILICALLVHPLYIPEKFNDIISSIINTITLIFITIIFYFINLKINNFKTGFGFNFISSISGLDIKIFMWSWLLIYLGIILSMATSIYFFKKNKVALIEEND